MPFSPSQVKKFYFSAYRFDAASATAYLEYAFDSGERFVETLHFPGAVLPLDAARQAALDRVLRYLHLVAGVSYYKAAAPPELVIETGAIDAETAEFLQTLYLHGLGEFAYKNRLDLRDKIRFPAQAATPSAAPPLALPRQTTVAIGGGKDSLVSVEILRAAAEPFSLFSVGNPPVIRAVSESVRCLSLSKGTPLLPSTSSGNGGMPPASTGSASGISHLIVQRKIAPELLKINREGAYNGHVPISAIIAFIGAAAAILQGFDTLVMSNERSAGEANVRQNGLDINHQYSKTLQFERDVAARFARILPGFRYFSLLRPMAELDIARLFARSAGYDAVFSSCNGNYKIASPLPADRWCGDCPKCRFVFLALAPFMDKARLLAIFGKNMLDDPAQQSGFAELLGFSGHKPFECVGELAESQAALYLLTRRPQWREEVLLREFAPRLPPNAAELARQALRLDRQHEIPAEFLAMLRAYRRDAVV